MGMTFAKQSRAFVSAREVAELAGVSRSAVSRTFTEGASVSEQTRRKVLRAAEKLGYHVNHLARGLIRERSGIVCIIVADVGTPYQSKMLNALTRRLQAINRIAMVINTSGAASSVEDALRKTLNYRADASIVLSGTPAASLVETCLNNGQRLILVNRDDQHQGPDRITIDNADAAREAFAMLWRAGCRRLAVVSSLAGTHSLVSRERAFEEAAAKAGASVVIKRSGPTAYQSGLEAGRALLSGSQRPEGIFCVTDLLACGLMDAARHEFRMRIPEELCVVGFDDIDQSGWGSYNLTTFRQPIDRICDHICDLLEHDPAEAPGTRLHSFQTAPVWRGSVRPK